MGVQRRGFLAKHVTVCGGHLQATNVVQKIFSHSRYGDANYENKEDCDWVIEAPAGKNVHLSFLSFEMEDEQDCGYDFIEVFSGYDAIDEADNFDYTPFESAAPLRNNYERKPPRQ